MIRSSLVPCLLLLALACPSYGAPEGKGPQAKTPQELFKLYQGCYDSKIHLFSRAKLYDLTTPDSQVLLFMRAGQEASAATRVEGKVDPKRVKALEALVRKHGLDPAKKPLEGGPNMSDELAQELFMKPDKMVAHLRKLLKPAKDQAGLIKGLFRFAYSHASEHSDLEPLELRKLQVKGERAQGREYSKLTTDVDTMTEDAPFFLAKIKGNWRYDLVAVFKDMVSHMKKR